VRDAQLSRQQRRAKPPLLPRDAPCRYIYAMLIAAATPCCVSSILRRHLPFCPPFAVADLPVVDG